MSESANIARGASPRGASKLRRVASSAPRSRKDISVQNLRGLAVLLLVAGHVYGLSPHTGLRQPHDTVGHYLTSSLEYLRMPLFTVISGYVYGLRPVSSTDALTRLMRGKVRRLLVPLVPLTALVGLLQVLSGSVNGSGSAPSVEDVGLGYLYGYSHLWFLYSIFVVFLAAGALDALGWLSRLRPWAATWTVGASAYVLISVPDRYDLFSINGALRLFPFFVLGYGIKNYSGLFRRRKLLWAAVPAFAVSFSVDQVLILRDVHVPDTASRALAVVVGTTGIFCLFRIRHVFRSRLLGWIGTYAFTIYLLHTIANKGTKVALTAVGITQPWAVFGFGLVAAILLPVAFHLTAGRLNTVRTVILGEKPVAPVVVSPHREDATAPTSSWMHRQAG